MARLCAGPAAASAWMAAATPATSLFHLWRQSSSLSPLCLQYFRRWAKILPAVWGGEGGFSCRASLSCSSRTKETAQASSLQATRWTSPPCLRVCSPSSRRTTVLPANHNVCLSVFMAQICLCDIFRKNEGIRLLSLLFLLLKSNISHP